jgi:hypothetical protein
MTGSNGPCKTIEKTSRQYSFYDFDTCYTFAVDCAKRRAHRGWRFGLGQIACSHDSNSGLTGIIHTHVR